MIKSDIDSMLSFYDLMIDEIVLDADVLSYPFVVCCYYFNIFSFASLGRFHGDLRIILLKMIHNFHFEVQVESAFDFIIGLFLLVFIFRGR